MKKKGFAAYNFRVEGERGERRKSPGFPLDRGRKGEKRRIVPLICLAEGEQKRV